jgi:hypothetical protein
MQAMSETKIEELVAPTESEPAAEQEVQKPEAKKPKAKKPKAEISQAGEYLVIDTGKEYDDFEIPKDSTDIYFDNRLDKPVTKERVHSLANDGWLPDEHITVKVSADGVKHVSHGQTRWRATPAANALRKKAGLPPLQIRAWVTQEDANQDPETLMREGLFHAMKKNHNLDASDPMTVARNLLQLLSGGMTEKELCEGIQGMTLDKLHGYHVLFGLDESVQELVAQGDISFAAAVELARKAADMTPAAQREFAEQIVKMAQGGVRVTTAKVKAATGEENKVATKKDKKQLILDLQSLLHEGTKQAKLCTMASIIALEVDLGTRTVKSYWSAKAKLDKGEDLKIDFTQYQDGHGSKVKGQE